LVDFLGFSRLVRTEFKFISDYSKFIHNIGGAVLVALKCLANEYVVLPYRQVF